MNCVSEAVNGVGDAISHKVARIRSLGAAISALGGSISG